MDCNGNCGEWKRWKFGCRGVVLDTWGITVWGLILRPRPCGGELESELENRIA